MKTKTAAEMMSRSPVTITPDTLLTEVIAVMLQHKVSCLPVVERGDKIVGVITEFDVMNFAFSGEADRTRVSESMSKNVVTFAPTDNLETIVNTCVTRRLHRAPVVQNGKLVGIISRRDILREMLAMYKAQ